MSETKEKQFDAIKESAESGDVMQTLAELGESLRAEKKYHQLFEALKMQTRFSLGLPLLYENRPEQMDQETQNKLEDGLLDACRTVGTLLAQEGKLREGWVYLQPVGDPQLNESLIKAVDVTDDNLDEVIDVSLLQQAAPGIGYSLVLEKYGTCNAITSFDSSAHSLDTKTKRILAGLLTDHLYQELMTNLKSFLEDNGRPVNEGKTLIELVRANKPTLAGIGPLADATHLASCMRIGRLIRDDAAIQKLAEMAEYGCQLGEPFHFPGDPPFENTYRDHLLFYRALISDDKDSPEVKSAIQFFDQKSADSAGDEYNPVCDEVFVDLLYRLGKNQRAIEVSIERLSKRNELTGIAPAVYELAQELEHYQTLERHYQSKDDLLGYTVSLLLQKTER